MEETKGDKKEHQIHKSHHGQEHHNLRHNAKKIDLKINLKNNFNNLFVGVLLILGLVMIINIFLTFNLNNELNKNIETAKEKSKPAKIEVFSIKNSKCSDCADLSAIIAGIKGLNANITKEKVIEFNSKEGKEIIAKYNIAKAPAVVVTGEIEKINVQGLEKRNNALLLAEPPAPYTNTATGSIEGRVILYYLEDISCAKCNNLNVIISQIKSAGVKVYQQKNVDSGSDEGKALIKKYSIQFVPTLILSKDAGEYSIIKQAWKQIGSKESDGAYVLRQPSPPFMNLTSNKLRGIVNIIYLTDKSCGECYNTSVHKSILTSPQSFGLMLDKEESYDISDEKGKEFIAKYNITKVPTIILSSEAEAYPTSRILKQFFSLNKDGSYIFTKVSSLGSYKDLETNQVIHAQQTQDAVN